MKMQGVEPGIVSMQRRCSTPEQWPLQWLIQCGKTEGGTKLNMRKGDLKLEWKFGGQSSRNWDIQNDPWSLVAAFWWQLHTSNNIPLAPNQVAKSRLSRKMQHAVSGATIKMSWYTNTSNLPFHPACFANLCLGFLIKERLFVLLSHSEYMWRGSWVLLSEIRAP